MRKTECYGDNCKQHDFEWPKEYDLLHMLKNMPIKVKDLKYNKTGYRFGAFQLILSNGTSSPVFIAKTCNGENLQSFDIKDYSDIKRGKGS